MDNKVLITDYVHNDLIEGLTQLGYTCDYRSRISLREVKEIISKYKGVVINSKIKMDRDMIDRSVDLQFIARLGSGLEIIDTAYAASKSIHVFNSPEGNRNAVAEHAVGLILAVANNYIKGDREVRARRWDRESNRGIELENKTLGIIGFGNAGRSLASKFSSWGMKLLAYDPYLDNLGDASEYVQQVQIEEIVQQSDIISFHVPLTQETEHMADKAFFDKCKDGVIIINSSRGKVVHTQDLLEAIQVKKVGGAGLDVFENEKPLHYCREEIIMYNKLHALEQVILTPHVAGWTHLSLKKIANVLLSKISGMNKPK